MEYFTIVSVLFTIFDKKMKMYRVNVSFDYEDPHFLSIRIFKKFSCSIQGVIEMCDQILTTSYWLHVELGKNIEKILCQKIK
jgi:hypothetical protein